jgi:hypothetical protein
LEDDPVSPDVSVQPSWKGRRLRSKLLIILAYAVVLHKHSRYLEVYKGQAILRVAERILKDVRRLAMEAQEATPTPA